MPPVAATSKDSATAMTVLGVADTSFVSRGTGTGGSHSAGGGESPSAGASRFSACKKESSGTICGAIRAVDEIKFS